MSVCLIIVNNGVLLLYCIYYIPELVHVRSSRSSRTIPATLRFPQAIAAFRAKHPHLHVRALALAHACRLDRPLLALSPPLAASVNFKLPFIQLLERQHSTKLFTIIAASP